jgi:transcriptional regulator with GAF, ATPase, and Fis domain
MRPGFPADTLPTSDGAAGAGRTTAGAFLTLALECDRPLVPPSRHFLRDVDVVLIGRDDARSAERVSERGERRLILRVPSARMSARHFELVGALGRWTMRDAGSRNGVRVNGSVQTLAVLRDGDVIDAGHTFFVFREPRPSDASRLSDVEGAVAADDATPAGLATLSIDYERVLGQLEVVARSRASIVLTGETGTGKELVARAVHALSGRRGAFVAVNCGAIPPTLMQSELFGHRKGSFSGATADRPGLVLGAAGGTLLLDEIGDLSESAQAAILRVLQEREVVPVGANRPIPVDFRLVAATHRPLSELVAYGRFRADLSARVAGYELKLPPLRERREDLGLLVAALLRRIASGDADRLSLSGAAARALFRYEWPLNIRELQKALEAAVPLAVANGGSLALEHLPLALRALPGSPAAFEAWSDEDAARRRALVEQLRSHAGSVSATARAMGKARSQLQRWIRRYRIDPRNLDP